MNKQFCSECGYDITEPSKFCPSCGHPISTSTAPMQQANTAQPLQQSPQGKKSNNNKLFAIIAGVIVVGAIFFFMQKDAPEDVAKEFFEHVMSFDIKKAEQLISSNPDSSVMDEFQEISESLDSLPIELSGQMKLKHKFTVLNVKKSSNKATVHATVSLLDFGFEDEASFQLVKEKGKWKISSIE